MTENGVHQRRGDDQSEQCLVLAAPIRATSPAGESTIASNRHRGRR